MRARSAAIAILATLVPAMACAQGSGAPTYLDCTLTTADGKRSDVHYRLTDATLLQFDEDDRGYTGADFAREPCSVTSARIQCRRETRAPLLPNPVIRRLEIDRSTGAITLSVTGMVYAGFDAKGMCAAGVDRVTGDAPARKF